MDSIKYVIYIVTIIIILLIVVWILGRAWMKKQIVYDQYCPDCHGEQFHRVHRRYYERIFGVGIAFRRVRCANPNCFWEGLRGGHKHSS